MIFGGAGAARPTKNHYKFRTTSIGRQQVLDLEQRCEIFENYCEKQAISSVKIVLE
jgi:hypothetical protein